MSTSEPPRVLSVEDNQETQLLLKHLMTPYKVTFASNAEEALEIIDTESFDALLLDINLGPGKSGTELLHTVRDLEDVDEIPAVALTAYAMPGDREELLEEGFDGYVDKPFTREEVLETLEQTL